MVAAETAVVREQFRRNHVGLLPATPPSRTRTPCASRGSDERVRAGRIVIAVGTRPARPDSVAFDDRTIIDSDGLLKLERRVPRTMTIVGAGVIGVEYASMFGALGTKVTVVDQRDRVLKFLDGEIGEAFSTCCGARTSPSGCASRWRRSRPATGSRACGWPRARS